MNTFYQKIGIIFLLFAFGLSSCKKSLNENVLDQIDFRIIATDENKSEKIAFASGEDVGLSFIAINNSGNKLELKLKSDYLVCKIYQNETDFFLVKKKSENFDKDSSYSLVGKPYFNTINCQTINLPHYFQIFPEGETVLESDLWSSNPENGKLASGKYFTVFVLTLEVEGQSKTWNLRTDFEVK